MFSSRAKQSRVTPDLALPGRSAPAYPLPGIHAVLGSPLLHYPSSAELTGGGLERIYLAMGCFWGAEELYWSLPGVVDTSVGYMGGFTPHPTYAEVCSSLTGHTETVFVAYRPEQITTWDILRVFWESHDPTQGDRQGNDLGSQYRSAIFHTSREQELLAVSSRDAYALALAESGYPRITTEVLPASSWDYYLAEEHHQQYLYKVPNGYRCHARTGLSLPTL